MYLDLIYWVAYCIIPVHNPVTKEPYIVRIQTTKHDSPLNTQCQYNFSRLLIIVKRIIGSNNYVGVYCCKLYVVH